jgi:hypothetical protein
MIDSLNWPREVPKEFYFEAVEAMYRQRIKDLKAAKAYHQKANKLKAEYQAALHELIGSEHLERYQRLHNIRVKKFRKAAVTVAGTTAQLQQREAQRVDSVKKSMRQIEKSGVDLKKLAKLRESYENKVGRLFERTVGEGTIAETVPKPKNCDYEPPYLLDAREFEHYESDSFMPRPSLTRYLNGSTGEFGSRTRIHFSGADEFDVIWATCRTGFMFLYRSPTNGVPIVNLSVEAIDVNYDGSIENECGRSDASVRQLARFYGQVYTGGGTADRTYCEPSIININRRAREDRWSGRVAAPGTDVHYSFPLATPVRADRWVLIGIGVETYNWFLSNDCAVDSTIEARLFARCVGIATTG